MSIQSSIDDADRNISLFHEGTGRLLGRISEAELALLQDALEEEAPGDDDYWINSEEIDALATNYPASPHLIGLLRDAVGDDPDGADIRFERDGETSPASE